ncbi:unnamed protein product [Pedinophyceae sp. YPF-701]|nr:unnamed protein product [Pedinophyceae sp. YPF-701]
MSASGPVFAVLFVGNSFPIPSTSLQQVDATHWVLDVCAAVGPNYQDLKDVCLFLTQPGSLDATCALGLYVSVGGSGWSYRGCVAASRPSEVMPLLWPESSQPPGPGAVQIGISLEPAQEVAEKEAPKVAAKGDFARRVGLDLFRYLESFNIPEQYLPSSILDRWFQKFQHKLQKDPDFLTRQADAL